MEIENLPTSSIKLNTVKRLVPALRGTVYEAMLDAISEEFALWRDQIKLIKTAFYELDNADEERLRQICALFSIPLILSVRSDIEYLREEVRSIPFKILYKGTAVLYKSFFYAIQRVGEVMLYTHWGDTNQILRLTQDPIFEAANSLRDTSFRHLSDNNYTGYIKKGLKLDEIDENGNSKRFLDDKHNEIWKLDTEFLTVSTNHIGVEYFIDRIIIRNGKEYLMTNEYLDYLQKSMNFARRAKEVPHIGSQLSIQTDSKGLCNYYNPAEPWTVPSLKLKAATIPNFFDIIKGPDAISIIEFGVGSQSLPSVQEPNIKFPKNLALRVASTVIPSRCKFANANYTGAVGEYTGQQLTDFAVEVMSDNGSTGFDGKSKNYSFTLPYAPIKKGTVSIRLCLGDNETTLADDALGRLLTISGTPVKGNIDYKTGLCHITTEFTNLARLNIDPLITGVPNTHYTCTVPQGVLKGSVKLTWAIQAEKGLQLYQVSDTPQENTDSNTGVFLCEGIIEEGSIDYNTGAIDITFNQSHPAVDKSVYPFKCEYSYNTSSAISVGTQLQATYFFTDTTICITEAGFRDVNGNLVAYATFPPFEFVSNNYHLNFMLLVARKAIQKS